MKTIAHLLTRLRNLVLAVLVAAATPPAMTDGEISGFAFLQDDGLLKITGYRIHLYGIYIPATEQTCYTFVRPVPCGSRSSLALNFKIEGDFVYCTQRMRHADDSITASCTLGNEDLSEWMLQKGWQWRCRTPLSSTRYWKRLRNPVESASGACRSRSSGGDASPNLVLLCAIA